MKKYKLSSKEIKQLVTGYGGCICTDKITVDGMPVLYMYKDKPINDMDSGWRFFSGFEDDDYMKDNSNHSVYDVNTIANYESSIIPFLDLPVGSELERDDKSQAFRLLK